MERHGRSRGAVGRGGVQREGFNKLFRDKARKCLILNLSGHDT